MDLLQFATGPALKGAIVIFVVGVLWRLLFLLRMKKPADLSESRGGNERLGGLWMIASRSINHGPLTDRIKAPIANAYLMHMVLFVVIFFASGHIDLIRENYGFGWPALPAIVVRIATFVCLSTIVVAVIRRLKHPVLRLLSNFDDWFSLLVTALPVLTGLLVGLAEEPGDTLKAIHVLTFNLLLIWFPFGKLMHAFLIFGSRYSTGVAFAHKGLRI
ncbi:MAG: nitrate reductase [Woeseiaceae bacterium]|nr:nitrate reductase [Woeseiaceae bacterium]